MKVRNGSPKFRKWFGVGMIRRMLRRQTKELKLFNLYLSVETRCETKDERGVCFENLLPL